MNRTLIAENLKPTTLVPAVLAGLIVGILAVILEISFAALIFSGDASTYVSLGIGLALFSSALLALIVALTSSFPVSISVGQDSPAAILALVVASISTVLAQNRDTSSTLATIIAALALTSVLTGAFFFGLGWFRLGRFIRYIPFPVVGGFLAGTGWLLVQGGISVMTGQPVTLDSVYFLSLPLVLVRWFPGALLAVVLLLVLRRWSHALIVPSILLGAIIIFYVALGAGGLSIAQARERSWMLGPFPEGGLFQFSTATAVLQANWGALLGQADKIATILIVSVIAFLLNASGIELATQHDLDFNRELKAVGFANIVAGLAGGWPGYHMLGGTTLSYKMGARSRLTGITAALLIGFTLFFGASLLEYFPRPVLGGLLVFLGLSFLVEWLYDAFFKLPRLDYVLILLILVVIGVFGFLPGVAVGVVVAMLLFIVNYSRIQVVKHSLTGSSFRSAVERSHGERARLREQGDRILILRLQEFIFFGTGQILLDQIRGRLQDPTSTPLQYLILDFRRVPGLDSSAITSFLRLVQLTTAQHIETLFTDVTPAISSQLARGGVQHIRFFDTLDAGVEWCENRILSQHHSPLDIISYSLQAQLMEFLPRDEDRKRLATYLERLELPPHTILIRQGDPADALYFIESGVVSVNVELSDKRQVRIRTIQSGTVGEVAVYLGGLRTAFVTTLEPTLAYKLSKTALSDMEQNDPSLASGIHKWIATILAERLSDLVRVMDALMD